MPVKKYSDSEKQRALELYQESGMARAARRTGIPKSTIDNWRKRAGVRTSAPQKMEAANRAKRAVDESRLHGLAADMFDDLEFLRQRLRRKTVEYRGQQAKRVEYDVPPADVLKNLVIAIATLTDKILLLTGKANSRQEVVSDLKNMSDAELIQYGRESLRELELIYGGSEGTNER
ncbi:MAG: transposase [Thermoleophilia bacterium]